MAEVWGPVSSHKIDNKFFIDHCQIWNETSFLCETVWFFSWANTHPFDLKFVAFCPKFSGDSYVKFQEKNYFGRIFWKFCANQSSTENCEISSYFRHFFFWIRIALKRFTQVLPYVVWTQVRRHVHKRITKRRYGKENPGRFVFEKPVLSTLGLGLTTPYSLDVLVWNFYQTFVTVSIEFWLRFEAQIRPTRLAIKFLLITLSGLKGSFVCVRNCLIFFVDEYSSVWPEICYVLSQIQWKFLRGISGKKTISEEFFENFVQTKAKRIPISNISLKFLCDMLDYIGK